MSIDLISLVAGSGWAAGVNLYAVAVLLGLLGRLGFADIPETLMRTDVLAVAGALYAVEFVADKVPYIDSLWDTVHTIVRPLGAATIGYLLTGETDTIGQAAAAGASALLAASSHTAKATARGAVNLSPEPASNILVSLFEDGLVAGVVALAVAFPVAALVAVVVLLAASLFLAVKLWGVVRRRWQRAAIVRDAR
jgi:hypothetical protein